MIDFKQIDDARNLLGLGRFATLKEIEESYRKLALKLHPDRSKAEDKRKNEELLKRINEAKDILLKYCLTYRYSFKKEDVQRNSIDPEYYKHLKRFYDGWLGDLDL